MTPRRWRRSRAAERLASWGGRWLAPEKIERLLAGAASSVGVRVGDWQRRQIRDDAGRALAARQEARRALRRLRELAAGNAVLQAQAQAVGVATACVLWTSTGDPTKYHAAAAYRKAMGLNLAERSSGRYQGRLRISKRGRRGRDNGSISRRCGWCSAATCALVRGQEGR